TRLIFSGLACRQAGIRLTLLGPPHPAAAAPAIATDDAPAVAVGGPAVSDASPWTALPAERLWFGCWIHASPLSLLPALGVPGPAPISVFAGISGRIV